jgi:hypothetical protein
MRRTRPPVPLFESNRGRDLRVFSVVMWALVFAMAFAVWLSLTEAVAGGDSVSVLLVGQLLLLGIAIMTDRRRRRTITRIYRVPEGLIFEMAGLAGPLRRYVRTEDFGRIRASPPGVEGRMKLNLRDGGPQLVMYTGHAGFNLGLPKPKHQKR